jgi:hypothetical protein
VRRRCVVVLKERRWNFANEQIRSDKTIRGKIQMGSTTRTEENDGVHSNIRYCGVDRQLNSEDFLREIRLATAHEPLLLPK